MTEDSGAPWGVGARPSVHPHAGHSSGVAVPCLPAATDQAVRGGSPQADDAADAGLWPRILAFPTRLEA
jgi:hypothetical protein